MNQLSSNTPLTDKLIAENSIFCDSDNLCKLRDHACILELRILAKDALIEQMREALEIAYKYLHAHAERTKDKYVIKDLLTVKAAIAAAKGEV